MNILSMLLGQQAGAAMGEQGQDIIVNMPRQDMGSGQGAVSAGPSAQEIDQYTNMGLDNTEAIMQRDRALKAGEEAAEHKGVFGVKGTLRDVLGVLGDAFLVQGGSDAIYRPQRQQEKLSDAVAGSTVDPVAAQERAMGVDPGFATKFGLERADNETANVRNQISQGALTRKVTEAAMARSGQIMAAAVATRDPAQIEQAKQAIMQLAQVTNIPVEQLMAGGSPELIAGREATANQSLNLPLKERTVAVAEGNLEARNRSVGIMAQRLGLDERKLREAMENNNFDQLMDMFDMSLDVQKEDGRNRRDNSTSRSTSTSTAAPKTGGFTIRPVGRQ